MQILFYLTKDYRIIVLVYEKSYCLHVFLQISYAGRTVVKMLWLVSNKVDGSKMEEVCYIIPEEDVVFFNK